MGNRLDELRGKDQLTQSEMEELLALTSAEGAWIALPEATRLGISNLDRFVANTHEATERYRRAREQGCYIEVTALRVQQAELWLRMYWAAKNPRRAIYAPGDKRTFGAVIEECAQLGFDPALVARLREFNRDRIDAVHKYFLGDTDYEALGEACARHDGLNRQVVDYVIAQVAVPADPTDHPAGAIMMAIFPVHDPESSA